MAVSERSPLRPDVERVKVRRELIENYHRRGFSAKRITEELTRDGLFLATSTPVSRRQAVNAVLAGLHKDDAQRYQTLLENAQTALREYIGQQEYLYTKAVENGDYRLAAGISRGVAQAHGIVTERSISAHSYDPQARRRRLL